MNCIFCHKENLTTDIVYEDDQGDGFGWTYGKGIKKVNAEIAKKIREKMD